jgi:hypothetical protein
MVNIEQEIITPSRKSYLISFIRSFSIILIICILAYKIKSEIGLNSKSWLFIYGCLIIMWLPYVFFGVIRRFLYKLEISYHCDFIKIVERDFFRSKSNNFKHNDDLKIIRYPTLGYSTLKTSNSFEFGELLSEKQLVDLMDKINSKK